MSVQFRNRPFLPRALTEYKAKWAPSQFVCFGKDVVLHFGNISKGIYLQYTDP